MGLFGGSFNPPHQGHLHVSETALIRGALDQVWWMVTPGNPLKDHSELAPLAERLRHCRQVANHPKIRVTAFEARYQINYTEQALTVVKRYHPNVRFVWLMGADNLAGFHRWDRILGRQRNRGAPGSLNIKRVGGGGGGADLDAGKVCRRVHRLLAEDDLVANLHPADRLDAGGVELGLEGVEQVVIGHAVELFGTVERVGRRQQTKLRNEQGDRGVGHDAHVDAPPGDLFGDILFAAQLRAHEGFDGQFAARDLGNLVDEFLGDLAPGRTRRWRGAQPKLLGFGGLAHGK